MSESKPGTLKLGKGELVAILQALGAEDAEGWADSQLNEDIPQLARFLFLRSAWKHVLNKGDIAWIENAIAAVPADSNKPFAGMSHSLRRLIAAGADPADIAELARNLQAEILFSFCYLLDDPFAQADDWPDDAAKILEGFGWSLFETNEDEKPLHGIGGLHESVLGTDPSGAEMRPFGREQS